MYKIIFFDIDGTLRDESYGIPDSAKMAIKMCKENGYYVCLCTGRTINTITDDIHDLKMDGIIAGGGSHIEFLGKTIKKSFFDTNEIEKASLYLKDTNKETAFTFETEDNVFMNNEAKELLTYFNEQKFNILNEEERKNIENQQKIIYEDNIDSFNSKLYNVNKICLWCKDSVFENLKYAFYKKGFQLAQSFQLDHRNYYEIIQKECNKGEAINTLCDYLKIPVEKTIAFGDGRNDIDMLKSVGLSIGVKNGSKEILEYVDSVCEEPMKDGIYLELKRRNII